MNVKKGGIVREAYGRAILHFFHIMLIILAYLISKEYNLIRETDQFVSVP